MLPESPPTWILRTARNVWFWPKNKIQNGGRDSSLWKMWCKWVNNWLRYTSLCTFKLAAAAILNFTDSWILGSSYPYMANVYRWNKLGAHILIGDRNTAEKAKFKMAAAAILHFQRMLFWSPSNPRMARMKPHTKLGANRSIIGQCTV